MLSYLPEFAGATLYPSARSAPALAPGEARGAARGVEMDLVARLRLECQPLVERQALSGQRGAAVGEHRRLGEGGERLGVLQRAVERAYVQLGDQPHPEGLARIHDPPGEDHVECAPEPDDARQPL